MAWLWAELLSEPLFLESDDNASEGGEQELPCSSTRVASLWSDAVPAEEWSSYIAQERVCNSKNRAFNHRETLLIKNMF